MTNVLALTEGLTLTLVSVLVVFGCLIILYFVYNLSGNIFSGKFSGRFRKGNGGKVPDETAAAIALALETELGDETGTAIATALCLELDADVHDIEPGTITIARNTESAWKNKSLNFRRNIH